MLRCTGTGSSLPASPSSAPSWKNHHGAVAGARRFVRVLQLLADHSLDPVRQAVEACRREQLISAEAVIQRTRTLAACESRTHQQPPWTTELTTAPQVHVPLPDLSCFNQLLDSSAEPRRPR